MDYKDQLAAIKDKVLKTKTIDAPKSEGNSAGIKILSSKIRTNNKRNSGEIRVDDFIARLPLLGRIINYNVEKGYGFVQKDNKKYFIHATKKLPLSKERITRDLTGELVVYALGSTKDREGLSVVQWALVDEVPWPDSNVPDGISLGKIRSEWLNKCTLNELLDVVRSEWYQGTKNGSELSNDLSDQVLADVVLQRLKVSLPEEWAENNVVREAIKYGRYDFLNRFKWGAIHAPDFLLKEYSAEKLALLGCPHIEWLQGKESKQHYREIYEWACRSALSLDQAQKWEAKLAVNFPDDSIIAIKLLESSWRPKSLGVNWIKRLIADNRLESSAISNRVNQYPDEISIWQSCLPYDEQIDRLVGECNSIEQLIDLLLAKNNPGLDRSAVCKHSISVDIESDGTDIWEIGVAGASGSALLLSRDAPKHETQVAVKELENRINSSRLVIGHNIIAWDWPILADKFSNRKSPLLWDTMLVAFMLAPWKKSHSLGGSHRADEDAIDAYELFKSQLEQIDGSICRKILLGEIEDTETLFRLISKQFESSSWLTPDLPNWLSNCKEEWTSEKILITHPLRIKEINWVPNITVVNVNLNESLTAEFMVIGSGLNQHLESRNLAHDPFGVSLLHVLNKAILHGIDVLPSMLPLWIRMRPGFEEAIIEAVIVSSNREENLKIAAYTSQSEWYERLQNNNYLFLDPPNGVFVADDSWIRSIDLPKPIQGQIISESANPRLGGVCRFELSAKPKVEQWIIFDPAADLLSNTGKCFRSVKTIDVLQNDSIHVVRTEEDPKQQPQLLVRAETTLYPRSQDQSEYWIGVMSGLHAITPNMPVGVVPVLLIGSSISSELLHLLEQSLCELSLGLPYYDHHSRKDRLLMASKTPGACLVGTIENWSEWHAIADSTNIKICPIIECLPIEYWYAIAQKSEDSDHDNVVMPSEFEEADRDRDDTEDVIEDEINDIGDIPLKRSIIVAGADIAARTSELVLGNVNQWIKQFGLDRASHPCIILDPRIQSRNREIRQLFDCLELKEREFEDSQRSLLRTMLEPLGVQREAGPSDYESMRRFLEKHWNYGRKPGDSSWIADFREATQKPAIESIMDRSSDVLVSLPTGEGKSVLFQVPALCKGLRTRRLTIVISPLRALMRDQVKRLNDIGFNQSVDYLTADRPRHEIDDVYQGVLDHRIVLLYVAPERFRSKRFIDVIDRRYSNDGAFEYVVVDEAHCISQWGYEFRPDYFYALNTICERYRSHATAEKTPVLLLSATVTASNRDHLSDILGNNEEKEGRRYFEFKAKPEQYYHPIRSHIEIRPTSVPGKINVRPRPDWPIAPRLENILSMVDLAKRNVNHTGQHSSLIIFVSRRDHAEELSFMLGKKFAITKEKHTVDYFHAGLDSETREEIYRNFLEGKTDILVATKAFGMGMDIPHIHWAVHLSPPPFLEDYLQEVGRIGRGETERNRAKLDQLTACLMYSQQDFESNRTYIQQNRIELRQILDLYDAICNNTQDSGDGLHITMMPDSGFSVFGTPGKQRAGCVQVRKMLYWLERLGRIDILAMVPSLLSIELNYPILKKIVETEKSPLAEVAALLLSIPHAQQRFCNNNGSVTNSRVTGEQLLLDKIIDGLSGHVGVVLGRSFRGASEVSTKFADFNFRASSTSQIDDAIINLSQIWRDTSLSHIDDVLSVITLLEERLAVKVKRTIRFSRRSFSDASQEDVNQLFNYLQQISRFILLKMKNNYEYIIDFEEISKIYPVFKINNIEVDIREVFERPLCYLLRSVGVRIRDKLVDGNRVTLAVSGKRQAGKLANRIDHSIAATIALWNEFLPRFNFEDNAIEISRLLAATRRHSANKRYREFELRRYLGLLSMMRLISVSDSIVPMSYILNVHKLHEVLDENDHPEVWTELAKVNRFTELRSDALEIFVHLPPDARNAFIQGYFEQTTPDDLEAFLTVQLGQIEDPESGQFIMDKREQLQAKAVDKFLDRFSINPEEPNQWEAIKHPFDRNLLVNAGPGSGKTSVLIARIAYLIRFQHIRPEEILVLAFNRAVVFEIRAKVKEIFGKLGYGAYVRRLDVATFHGYATRNLGRLANETDDWNKDRSTLLRRFADKLDNDPVFRSSISGRIRCLLVDEFQDVNDDIYRIIRALSRQSDRAASVMVIGDDDQDILGWNRSNGESSDFYFRKFIKDYSLPENDILDLKVNFRSGSQIVSHTQDVLSRFFNKHGKDDRRIKQLSLRSATWAEAGSIVTIDYSAKNFVDAIQEVKKSLQEILSSPYQSVAILCRTNNEVAQAYHGLLKACPELIVQNSVSYPVARLRHIGLWLDLVKNDLIIQGDQPLTDNIFERVWSVYQTNDIPEIHNPRDEDLSPRQLWNLCLTEAAYPYLSHLIEFVENLDSDDVIRLLGRDNLNIHPPVVSTIHKVKGLEFDHVFILPSLSSFQIPLNNLDRAFDLAAEEARLQYVAMTRAKKSIVYFSGDRENAWFNTRPFTGNSSIGKILNGAPDEVAISWAWEEMHYNPYPESTLSYIQSKICVRDKLSIAGPGRNIMHKGQTKPLVQVGYLANKVGLGSPSSDLKVSAILRCIYSGKQYFGGRTADSVCKNGWGLVVLLEGILKSDPAANGSKLEEEELTNASASKAIAKNMLNIDEQSLRHHILGSPIIDDAESSDLSHVLDVRKSSNNAAQPLNLVALIYNQHSTVVAVGDIARFNSSGWFAVGLVDATCPMCGREEMHGYRKPYLTKASVLQHYWALVCLKCRKVYEPKSLDDQSIKRLNLYKIPAFKT